MMPFHFHLSCLLLFQIEIEVAKDTDVYLDYLRHHMPSSAHCFFWRANIHFQSRTYIYLQHDNRLYCDYSYDDKNNYRKYDKNDCSNDDSNNGNNGNEGSIAKVISAGIFT